MAKSKLTTQEQVDELLTQIESPSREVIIYLRQIVSAIDSHIAEQIKWNSLSFYFTGEMMSFDPKEYKRDILVCNLHRGKILLIFPTGGKLPDNLNGKNYPDGRKIIEIESLIDLKTKEDDLKEILHAWLDKVV
jgi:hypothetical protein